MAEIETRDYFWYRLINEFSRTTNEYEIGKAGPEGGLVFRIVPGHKIKACFTRNEESCAECHENCPIRLKEKSLLKL